MAIGAARGPMISTVELQEEVGNGVFVNVDHEMYEVLSVTLHTDGMAKVTLIRQFGEDWVLTVAKEDWEAEMWEVEGQS